MERDAKPSPVLLALIGVNVAVHVAWLLVRESEPVLAFMADHFLVDAATVLWRPWTLLTSAFSHISTMHLLFNLLALWVFGRDVAERIGGLAFLHLYVMGAVLASLGHVVYQLLSGSPSPALGASGAAMAIAVVFAALYPRRTLLVQMILPVPAAVAVAGYIVLDLVGALSPADSNVAHAAHLGGAAYGLGYWALRLRQRRR